MVRLVEGCLCAVWAGAGVRVSPKAGGALGDQDRRAGRVWVQGEGSPRRPRGGRGRGRVYKGSLRLSRLVPAGHPHLCSVHGASELSGPAESESAFGQGHRGFLCTVRFEKYRRNSRLPTFIWDAFSCEDKNPTQTSPSIRKRLISSSNQTEKAGCC